MSTARILFQADVIAVSRPGHDVRTAVPSATSMAFHSSIPPERPLLAGLITGVSVTSQATVFYPQTYAQAPAVTVHPYAGGQIYDEQIRYLQQAGFPAGIKIWQTSYAISCFTNRFQFSAPGGGVADPWRDVARDWLYFVWRVG